VKAALPLGAAFALLGAAPALATQRFAAPGGSTTSDCTSAAAPCELAYALSQAQTGDEVSLAAGTYNEGTNLLSPSAEGLDIHGPVGTLDAHIVSSNSFAALAVEADHVHDLSISESHAGAAGLFLAGGQGSLSNTTGLYENLRVTASGGAAGVFFAQRPTAGWVAPVLRNSVVTSEGTPALAIHEFESTLASNAQIDNVDASSTSGPALEVDGGADNAETVNLVNDVLAGGWSYTAGSKPVTVTISHSEGAANGPYMSTNLTGSGTDNINTDPLLVGGGDFHETLTSPTIDAGTADTADGVGGVDLDGGPRQAGSAPDIGADEFAVAPQGFTDDASGVSDTAATLNARINPGDGITAYHFEYGTTASSLGSSTPEQHTDATASLESVSAALTGLAPGTTYFYRVVGSNEKDNFQASTDSFTTQPAPPRPPAGGGGGGGGSGTAAKLSVAFKSSKQKLRSHKLIFTLTPTASCKATGTIALGKKTLARFTKQLHAGRNTITIKLSKKTLKALAHALKGKKTLALTLKATFSGASKQTHTLKLTR
jgi:hypothetical protein